MFTGLVESIGSKSTPLLPATTKQAAVSALNPLDSSASGGGGTSLTITNCTSILSDAALGDSISVNGTCLTITEFSSTSSTPYFKVGMAPETLRRTNLGALKQGDGVNLERSVAAGQRMGGHFVQGHVDTTARIVEIREEGNSLVFRLKPNLVKDQDDSHAEGEGEAQKKSSVLRYVVEKGYVALDGASLTVTKVADSTQAADDDGWFEIMMIAYTREKVVMGTKRVGDEVNVEIDMVGKYVEKSVQGYLQGLKVNGEGGGGIISNSLSIAGLVSC